MATTLSTTAYEVLKRLPDEPDSISGGTVKKFFNLNTTQLQEVKAELKEAGLIKLGRGRGGTISRIPDIEAPQPERKMTKEEALAIAREEKTQKTAAQKKLNAVKERVKEVGEKRHPEADEIKPLLHGLDWWYVEVWTKGSATIEHIEEDELL